MIKTEYTKYFGSNMEQATNLSRRKGYYEQCQQRGRHCILIKNCRGRARDMAQQHNACL